jgi:RNA-directed DNA polymerase
MSEKPVHSRLRRLVDWINLTGAKKVHSLIDKVYKRKNLEMAWEKVKANRGSGGVDGQTLEAFEEQLDQQLDRLQREPERGHLSASAGATTSHSEEG